MTHETKHLYNLDELSDYKIKDGYPDVKGWDVRDIDNRVVGKVDNLLVNIEKGQVVYLDVEVDKSIIDANYDPYDKPGNKEITEFVNKEGANHIIIPIGLVNLNAESKVVFTDIIDHRTFAETKRYRKGEAVNRAYEKQVLDSYERKVKPRTNEGPVNVGEDTSYQTVLNEERVREIARQEIKNYHKDKSSYGDTYTHDELERRRDHSEDEDRFYERREFDDERFKKRTPGL